MNKEFQTLRKKQRFSLRKLNIGVVSVLLGFTIFGYNLASQAPVAHAATSTVQRASTGSGAPGSSATGVVSGSQASNSQDARTTGSAATDSQTAPETQVTAPAASQSSESANSGNATSSPASQAPVAHTATPASTVASGSSATGVVSGSASNSQSSESANSGNATSSPASQAGTVSANQTSNTSAAGAPASSDQTVTVDETTLPATQAAILSTNLARLTNFKVGTRQRYSAILLAKLARSTTSGTDTMLPPTTQTYTPVKQPLLSDYQLHVRATGTRDGQTWVDKTIGPGIWDYRGDTLDTIFGKTSKPGTGIITSNPDKYFFAAYVDFSEQYHRVILLARSQDPSDKNLYSYTIHTYWQKTSTTTIKPGDSIKERYTGVAGSGGSKYDLIFHNYGDSFTVKLNDFNGKWGMLPVFDGGLLDPTYGSNSYKQNDTAAQTEPISFWASAIPQETSTKVRYVDQATGKDIVQPMEISGFGYQGFKVKGDAPTVKGYHLVSKPEFLPSTNKASNYEDGTISPYKVGQTYDLALSDSVVIKQTVIDTNGTVRATAYYNGSRLPSTDASKVLGREIYNDKMSFGARDGKFYTYTNRIGQVDDSYIYYYAKDSDPDGSEMRLHFIDVTGVNNSNYAPSDGPELDVDKVQTTHGNIGENYSFNYTVPTNYYEVGSSGVTGTYSKTHHDAYVYVKKQAENKLYAPVASDPLTVEQGTTLTTNQAKAAVKYNGDVPSDATYAWDPNTPVDTATVGSYTPNVIVTYGDHTTSSVPVTVNVVAKTDKGKYTVAAGKPVTLTHGKKVKAGDSLDSSAVTLTDAKGQTVSLPEKAKVVWTTAPATSEVGNDKTGQAKVVYGDTSESEPVTVTYNVTPNDADQYTLKPGNPVKVNDPAKLTDDEKGQVSAGITKANPTAPINSIKVNDDGSADVTFNDGSTTTVTANVIKKTDAEKYQLTKGNPVTLTHGQKVKAGDSLDSSAVTLKDAKGQTVSLPDGAKVVWTTAPATSEVGNDKTGQAKVVYGDQSESEPVTVTYNVTPNDADRADLKPGKDKAKVTATIGGSITRKYNGQAVNGTTVYGQITWTGKDTSNNQDFTLKHDISASDYSWYTMGKDGQYVKFDGKPTNAGTYYLILNKDYINKLDQANPNYDITKVDGAFTYIINKATATLNLAGSQDANYNGQSIAINYGNFPLSIKTSNDLTLTLPSGKSLDAGDVEITDANGNKVTAPTAIGTYTIKLTQAGLQKFESQTDNYAWASDGSATLTITRNDHVSVTMTNNADGAEIVVYTGKTAAIDPSKFTVTLGNGLTYQLKAGDLQFVDQTAGANTNVGTYQVELSQQGKANIAALEAANYGYDFSKAGNGTVTVTKATPTVTLNGDAEKTYDGTSIADYVPTITIKAPGTNSVTLTTGDFEWVKDGHIYTTAPSDAGTYTAELTEQGLNKLKAVNATNLDWSKITSVMGGTYKIDKAKVNATLSGNSETKTPSLNAGDYTLDLTVGGKQQTITLTNDDLVLSQNGQAVNRLTKAETYDVKFSQKFMKYFNSTYPSGNYDVNTSSKAIFTLDNSSQTINYVDANGKVIGSTNVGGDAIEGTTVPFDSQDHVPAGWVITNPSAAPTEVTLENGTTTIAIQHGTITVRPGEKAPTGKVPGDPSKTYAKMDDLTKTPTRTIIVAIPGETTPRTIPQSVTFERSATYDTVTGKATYSDWTQTGDTKSWAKVDPTLKGYTTIIDNQPGTTIPAVTDITEQTVNVTINVTYVKNAATITISGPAQSKTYDGQAAEITDEIANKISHQISGDSRLTLPDGSQVTLTKDDFSFAGPEGNILTGNPSSVGTYHIVLNKNGLYKIEGLDSNFTWSYDPQTSYVVYTINSAQAGSVAFNASATKTYDGSNVLNGASFTTQPSIVIKGADGKPLAGTKGYTFQSGDFEFVDSKGNVTLATIDSAGQITGPTNAVTYTIQLTQAGLNRIEAANPNVDFSNVKLADIGTGTLTINQYAPTLNLAGNGEKTYDGQTVTSAELIKSDKYNNITITFTVPKQGGGTTTVTYTFNPEMDYTGDYDWYENGAQIAAPKNAGTYTIQLKADQVKNIFNDLLSKDANYSYLKGNINTDKLRVSGKATYTINKKPLTVYLTGNGGMTYNGSGATMPLQDLLKNLTAEGLVGKETLGTFTFDDADFQWYVKNADGTYSVFNGKDAQGHSVQTPINVGTYYIGILPETSTNSGIDTLKRDNSNYDVTIDYSKYYQFDIKKAQGTATLSGNQTDTYNGQAHTINGYTLTVSGTGIQDGQTVTLNAGDLEFNVKGQWTTNVPVNAGNYQVRLNAAKLAELEKNYPNLAWDNDHVTNSALDYIVNPTQVTVSFTSGPSHSTYNGSALNIEYTKDFFQGRFAMNGVVAGQTLNFPKINSGFFEWIDASGNVMTSVPTNAGTYTLKVKDLNELNDLNPNYQLVFSKDTNGNDQNGWTWVIDKATARINFTSGSQTTPWTGKATVLDPNNFAVTITTDNGQALTSDALTVDDFQFYNQAGQAIDIPTEVGNYTIKLNATGLAKIKKDTANYVWTNIASGNYEITKAAATIKLDGNSSMTYNGQAASFPVNADGSLNGYTVTLSNGQTYTLKPGDLRFSTMVTGADGKSYLEVTNAPVNAGTYDVTLSDNGLANINKVDGSHYQYTLDSSTATFTINKADATIAINGSGKHTYDGQAAKTSEGNYTIQLPGQSTTTNVAADDLVFVDANGKVITAPTDAGTYTIALSDAYKQSLQGTYGNNYNLNYTNGTFTVAPKVVDLILNGTASQVYDGQPAKITDVSGLTLTWGDHTTITAPGGVKFTLTPDDLEVVDGQGNVPTKANEADQATNPYYIKLKDAVLAGLNSQNKNYTFKIGDTYARYTIFANKSNVKLTGKQFVNYGDNPMPAINIQDGNFKLTWTDASGKDQDITLTADDLTVEVPDGVSKDKYGLPTKAGQYVVKLKQSVIDKLNAENRNYHLSNDPNTNAWYVVKHRQVSFTINGTPSSTYNGQAAQIKDGNYSISFGPVSGNQNSGVLSDDQSAFNGIKWDAGDFEFVNGAPTNAGTYQVRLSKTGLQKLSDFAQGATGSNYDFSSVATIENGQITASSVTANYTINKNQLDISLTNKNGQVPSSIIGDYNLNADDYTLTITPKNTTVYDKYGKPLSFTYKLQNNDVFYVKGLPSNVGTYSVQLTAEALQKIEQQFGTDNFDYNPSTSASREITQGNAVITVSGGQTVYYNGEPAVLCHKKYQVTVSTDFFSTGVSLNKGDMAKMVFYIKNADGSYTELTDESGNPVKPTNAGTYYVGLNSDMVKMLEDATGNEGQNYKWTFNYAPYVIKSVNRTAIGNFSNNSNYNGQAIALQTITVTTKYPGATNTTYTLQNGDYEYVKDGQVVASPTDAGTYTIRLTTAGENHIKQLGNVEGAEENNVNWTIQFTGSYTINQVRMTVTVNGTQNETYDGTAKTINIGGKNGINVTLSDDGLTVPTIPTTGENALTAADFTIKDAAGNIVTNPTNAGHYKVYLNATGLAKLGKLSPNFTVPASLDQAGDLNIARKEVSVTEDSAWKTFDAQSAALTDDQFAHYKDAIINAGKDAGIKDGYSVDGLTIDGIDWWFDDTVDYGTQGSMKNPIKDIGIYNLRLNAKGQRELDVANPNYKIKVGDFQYHIYPEVVHIELSGNQDANWDNQPVPVNPTNFVPTFVVYGGPNGKNPGPDDKPLKNPVRDDGQPLTLPAGVQLEPGDYEFVDVHDKVIKNFTRADGTTSTNPFKVGTYYVRLTEAGWMKLAILSTDNVKYQYNGSTGTLNINSITPQFKLNGQNWKTYDGQPVSYKELTSVDPTTKQPLVTVSITSNEHTITFPLNDGDYVWSANGQALTSAPTNVGTYTITLNKDKVMKSLQNFISSNSDYQGAMNILADNIGGSALFEIKALQIANITADPSSGSKTYDGTAAQIDLSTLAKSIKATTGSGKNEKVWSLNTSNLTLVKDYTVTDAKGNVVTDFPINAGTYTFKLNDQGIKDLAAANTNFTIPSEINGYSYIFTINPVEAKAVLSGQAAKTYDGNQVTTAEINAGTSTVTVSINANKTVTYVLQDGDYIWYVKNADGSWTKLDKAPIDAGTYKVEPNNDAVLAHLREKIADDPEWTVGDIHNVFLNDSDLSGSAEFTIKKKPVTLIISDNQTSTADPIVTVNPQKITVSGNGITISNLKADDFQLQDIDGNVVKDPKLAGKYIVALTPAAQAAIQNGYANYQFSFMGTGLLDVQAKLTINFVDTDEGNKVIQTSTKSGDAGTPLSLSLTLPAGYQLADGQTLPTSYQFTDALTQTLNINLKHATQSVEDSKTVTRTINYTDPTTGEVKTLTTQPVTLTRTGSTDLVTHKTTWQDWTTGNWAAISANDIPTFAGYTPSQTSVAAETVTGQTSNSTVNITYTAGEQTVTIKFVDDNNGGQPVTSVTKAGQTGETITDFSNVKVPEYYQLAKNSSLPTSYTFTADKDQAITIHLIHATKTVDGNKPDTILSDVDKKQLIHTVTRTITDHVPGQEPLITKQSATITRRATYDEVTGKLSNFSDWTTAELPDYTAKGAAGYTASETDVPAETVTDQTDDSTVNITYTAKNQTGKISYQDRNGKEIDSTSLSGKTDETVAINPQAPTGWKITDGQNIPKTVTATADGVPMVVVKIEHATTKVPHTDPVKPGAKTPTGKVIDGAHDADLNKTITRTINVTTPNGKTTTTTQVAKIYRDATYDDVTGEVAYDDWSTDIWKAFTPTAIPGYTVETVPVVEVKNGQRDVTVNVTYTAKNIQNIIKYVDENGNVVKTDTVTGKLGDPIKVTIPTGYHVKDGKLPTLTIGDGAKSVQTVHVIKDQHNTDNPIVDHKDVLNIIKYVDENGNVVKTDTVTGHVGDPMSEATTSGSKQQAQQLPQTGNARHESGLAALGLALLGLIGLVPKKRRHDN